MLKPSKGQVKAATGTAAGTIAPEGSRPHLPGYFPSLDGFRGLAILLVMYIHLGRSADDMGYGGILFAHSLGWTGVDFFFVLSGFLITRILYEAKTEQDYFSRFYIRRTLRIFPLYYLAIVVVSLIYLLWPFAELEWPSNPLFVVFYLTNFLIAAGGSAGFLDHFWSLAVEEHFYLVWPFVVLKLTRRQIMGVALLIIAAAPVLRTFFVVAGFDYPAAYMLTPSRMDSLAMGALVALAVIGEGFSPRIMRLAWTVLIVAGTCLAVMFGLKHVHPDDPVIQTVGFSIVGLFAASLLVLVAAWAPLKAVFSLAVLRWFGKYSYGLYVWHPVIGMLIFYSGVREQFSPDIQNSPVWLGIALALWLLAGWLSYNLWEARFLRLKDRLDGSLHRVPAHATAGGRVAD